MNVGWGLLLGGETAETTTCAVRPTRQVPASMTSIVHSRRWSSEGPASVWSAKGASAGTGVAGGTESWVTSAGLLPIEQAYRNSS